MGCVELVVGMDRGDNYGINRRTCVWEGEGCLRDTFRRNKSGKSRILEKRFVYSRYNCFVDDDCCMLLGDLTL